jgi:hypothetical protein
MDVIDLLREANEPVPIPLELPDEDLLVEIEEQILIGLPDEFKAFLLTVSDVVYGSVEPVTVTEAQSHTYLPEVASRAWDIGVPREQIPICECDGDFFCINEQGIITACRGELQLEEQWQSNWDWAKEVWLES